MPESTPLAEAIIHTLDIAILRRIGDRRYEMFGRVPDFYLRLFSDSVGKPSESPWDASSMLEFFLEDAELFFKRNKPGTLSSGIWQEDNVQTGKQALIASAMCLDGAQLLAIRLLTDEFVDRSRILQKAREQLLERRVLHNNVEIYKHKARYDALTSLCNRAAFMETLKIETEHACETGAELSLLMLDIDDFKSINDIYGHLAGDTVLSTLGQVLRNFLRREDIACRYGGEEFAVLAPYTLQHQALRMAEKLRKAIAEHNFGSLPPVTVSIGCATYRRGELTDSFIGRADLALYDAKNSGKNMVRMR